MSPSVNAAPPPSLASTFTHAAPASATVAPSTSSRSGWTRQDSDHQWSSDSGADLSASSYNTASTSTSMEDNNTTDEDEDQVDSLTQIVYTSSASHRYLPSEELTSILHGSRKRNCENDITGLLLYRDGSFAQFLEGPNEAVQSTFAKIETDQRHKGVVVVLNRSVKKRDFPTWRMGYRNLDKDLKEENYNEDKGQVGGTTIDDVASGVFDLASSSTKDLTHDQMSRSIRTLIRVFHQSLSRPV
ncbi:unnamed protein product [Sympodiomycopsis kandeliae]